MLLALLAAPILVQAAKLEIKDTLVGKGVEVRVGDVVAVEYTGKLTDGKQFDSSKGKPPFEFQVGMGQVIPGWDKGLLGMREGGARVLVIPPDLAYGAQGAGGDIPPNATLRFDVRLVRVLPRTTIKVLTKGAGPEAKPGDSVEVHYRGKLASGKVFDSSYDRGRPMPFVIGAGVIPGFSQAVLGMRVGEKREVVIPAELAYGAKGIPPVDTGDVKAGSIIPANSPLTFEIELVKVAPPTK